MRKNKEIEVINGKIPYNEIKEEKDITFVLITKDEKILEETIKSIAEFYKEHKDMNINVVIPSDYEKLHEVSNGTLQCPFSYKCYIILFKLDGGGTTNDKKQ